jgi:hypothetical protein
VQARDRVRRESFGRCRDDVGGDVARQTGIFPGAGKLAELRNDGSASLEKTVMHEFRSLWVGERISPLEYLCIESFLAHGHRYVLYAYGPVAGLPPECELADAGTVLPEEDVFYYGGKHAGSPAGFANLFRYRLLAHRGGWWVDTDVLCCCADLPDSEYVFAQEKANRYGNAILHVPAGSALMSLAFERGWENRFVERWGTTGPALLTALIEELGLQDAGWTGSELYPWRWREALTVLDRTQTTRLERLSQNSKFGHFWNEVLRRKIDKNRRPPVGSFLDRLYVRYAVPFPASRRYTDAELRPQLTAERERLAHAKRKDAFDPQGS